MSIERVFPLRLCMRMRMRWQLNKNDSFFELNKYENDIRSCMRFGLVLKLSQERPSHDNHWNNLVNSRMPHFKL